MKTTLVLGWLPTTANVYINAARGNKFVAARIKKDETERVWAECKIQGIKHFKGPVKIHCLWYSNGRTDCDNLRFGFKVIGDGLVTAHVLPDDSMEYIRELTDTFHKGEDGVIVDIEEISP